jgi:hypothetical protein
VGKTVNYQPLKELAFLVDDIDASSFKDCMFTNISRTPEILRLSVYSQRNIVVRTPDYQSQMALI